MENRAFLMGHYCHLEASSIAPQPITSAHNVMIEQYVLICSGQGYYDLTDVDYIEHGC